MESGRSGDYCPSPIPRFLLPVCHPRISLLWDEDKIPLRWGMKFGYFTLTDNPPAYGATRRDPNQFLLEVLEECRVAEELGYHSAWVPEHHFGLFGCLPAPATFLAHVAARTKRIQLAPATV